MFLLLLGAVIATAPIPGGAQGGAPILTVPPVGGVVVGSAGTDDIELLVRAQLFDVASILAFDEKHDIWLSFIPGAPAMVNTWPTDPKLVEHYETIVLIRGGWT